MKKLKIGIVGVGGISYSHINGYRKDPNVELYAFCDINAERLKQKAEEFGITRCYTDEAEMLRDLPELDAVSVCVWNCNHAACTIAALNAGKHVLCEKPMAASVAEAEAMLEAAKRNNRLLMVGFCCRYGADAELVREFDKKGFFGDIYLAKASYLRRNGSPGGWFSNKALSSGGPLIDLGVHIIDLTRWLMGNPKPVSVYGVTFSKLLDRPGVKKAPDTYFASGSGDGKDVFDVEDYASAFVRYDSGAVLLVECSYSLNMKEDKYTIELFGSKGGAMLSPKLELYTDMNGYMTDVTPVGAQDIDGDAVMDREMSHFADCILNGTPCRAPAEDGVEIMRILEAIYKSAETKHEVIL